MPAASIVISASFCNELRRGVTRTRMLARGFKGAPAAPVGWRLSKRKVNLGQLQCWAACGGAGAGPFEDGECGAVWATRSRWPRGRAGEAMERHLGATSDLRYQRRSQLEIQTLALGQEHEALNFGPSVSVPAVHTCSSPAPPSASARRSRRHRHRHGHPTSLSPACCLGHWRNGEWGQHRGRSRRRTTSSLLVTSVRRIDFYERPRLDARAHPARDR